eukprot:6044146-Karenia_brevis.AAC.1
MALWKDAAQRRKDMAGIEAGIDRVATLALYRRRSLQDYERGVLRSILAGAVRTQSLLWKAGLVNDSACPYCNDGSIETTEHMWWNCTAWTHIRRRHWTDGIPCRESWPSCLRSSGIMPEGCLSQDCCPLGSVGEQISSGEDAEEGFDMEVRDYELV